MRCGVRQAGNDQVCLQLDDTGERRQIVDVEIDHQAEPAQQWRQVTEHCGPFVEVGGGLADRDTDGVGHGLGLVFGLLLGMLVVTAGAVHVGGQQSNQALPSGAVGRDPCAQEPAAGHVVEELGRQVVEGELGVEQVLDPQPSAELAEADGVHRRDGQGIAAHGRRTDGRREHADRVGQHRVSLHPVCGEGTPWCCREIPGLPTAHHEIGWEDVRPQSAVQRRGVDGDGDVDRDAPTLAPGQTDRRIGE